MFSSLGRRELGADTLNFAAYLTKPLKASQLHDVLVTLFLGASPLPAAAASESLFDDSIGKQYPLRILLAEDNQVNQKLATRLLQKLSYRADIASNGLEVLQALDRQPYDVVLMDVQMPEMDGLEATRQVRATVATQQPYIIGLTANAMQGDREMCLDAGMDDYVTKPIQVKELINALKRAAEGLANPARV
jgi:CheY-like chemotaxis protein